MFDSPDWVFTMFAFLGFLCCMIPLPWHLEAWNTGTCLYMIWTGLSCLIQFINSIVWQSNVVNWAPVWCDITSKFIIGANVAIPACSLCINRRLYHIASVSSVTKTRAQKRRDIMTDLAIGLGIPVLEMILQYIVQGHRFNIFEEVGCYPATFNTPPAYALVFAWPLVLGCISAYYCVRTIVELAQRRAQFMEFLSVNKNLSSSRYFRLMGLAGIEMLCTIPLGAYVIYLNATAQPILPWISWADTHSNFSFVGIVPSVVWRASGPTVLSIELSRWLLVVCAFVFFAFFGFADEARKNYRLAYVSVAKRVGISTAGTMSSGGGSWTTGSKSEMACNSRTATMPVFVTQRTEQKRDSLTSFSTDISMGEFNLAFNDAKEIPYSPTETAAGSISKESLPSTPIDEQTVHLPDTPALPQYIVDSPESLRNSVDIV
ncbi:pheromone A receptor-domain-containing protein [Suillus subluteus]|nr:pheromone A receptor-domain-containing protein [Suillus subluteus]